MAEQIMFDGDELSLLKLLEGNIEADDRSHTHTCSSTHLHSLTQTHTRHC